MYSIKYKNLKSYYAKEGYYYSVVYILPANIIIMFNLGKYIYIYIYILFFIILVESFHPIQARR